MKPLTEWSHQEMMDFEKNTLQNKWAVGVSDRGLGRYLYAIIDDNDNILFQSPHQLLGREFVQHIVDLHNHSLTEKQS